MGKWQWSALKPWYDSLLVGHASFNPAGEGTDLEQSTQQHVPLTIPFTTRVSVPAEILFRQIESESVLLNLQNERYFGLDEVGTRMWTLLTTSDSIQAAYDALLGEYEVDAELLRRNLQDLLAKLIENGLLEAGGG